MTKTCEIQRFNDSFFFWFVSLREMCRNTILLWSVLSRIDRTVCVFSKYRKIRIPFCPYAGKYKLEKFRVLAYFRHYMFALPSSNIIDSYKNFLKIWVVFAVCTLNSSKVQGFTEGSVTVHSFVFVSNQNGTGSSLSQCWNHNTVILDCLYKRNLRM